MSLRYEELEREENDIEPNCKCCSSLRSTNEDTLNGNVCSVFCCILLVLGCIFIVCMFCYDIVKMTNFTDEQMKDPAMKQQYINHFGFAFFNGTIIFITIISAIYHFMTTIVMRFVFNMIAFALCVCVVITCTILLWFEDYVTASFGFKNKIIFQDANEACILFAIIECLHTGCRMCGCCRREKN